MKDSIRVLIVDDHTLARQGIATRKAVQAQNDMQLVGEALNGCEALARVAELVPDVVLMDVQMPEVDGITATREIKARYHDIKILVLSSLVDESQIIPTLHAGASGYLLKDISPDQLMQAIRAVHRGETLLAPAVTKKLIAEVITSNNESHARLTEREHEVLALLGCGMSNKDMAVQLTISEKTVKFHVSNILGKLNLHDRTQAALFAIKHPNQ